MALGVGAGHGSGLGHGAGDDEDPAAEFSGDAGGILTEINITPLTDIFLVLLIIFMVTSSVMSQMGVDIELPKASHGVSSAQAEGVVVTLLPSGKIRIANQELEMGKWEEFESVLKSAFEHTKSKLVVLEGDKRVLLGSAIELMDHARKAGAESLAVATVPGGS